jgi:hypothetical protein
MGPHIFTFVVCIGWKGKKEEEKGNIRLFIRTPFGLCWGLNSGVLLAR